MKIEALFDPKKNIYRTIEKVITYGVSQEERLKAEISEYVVTESIEEQLEDLLSKMQAAMEHGGENEVGVWVSGFYGSGKSSFTKYLGLAFDDDIQIDGVSFRQHFQDRLKKSTTKALLNKVAKQFPAAIVMLDLASEQVAGSTMEEVSTVLYYKVLQWAGYSRNLKIAALERKLKHDKRYDEFLEEFKTQTSGQEWKDYRNDPLIGDSLIPGIAHKLYPQMFPQENSFTTATSETILLEDDRVAEMLDIAREATGKKYILFIVDEVGQYVGSRKNMILNLDGLAKNLKSIGDGKVWIMGTAQQTLTEDDPSASLNSPELYKLKDRFPIQIDLEANDIKEICYNRLLGKSVPGEEELGKRYDKYGPQLRQYTKLVDARLYGADFDRSDFINLYPFLPAHFEILLHLLGALAKSTGGIGLRSAIKVIQDILVDQANGVDPVAKREVGYLANTVTIYDALERDIQRAFPNIYQSMQKVKIRFPNKPIHEAISKTVCVLQILENLPVTIQNIASLMHAGVDTPSLLDEVKVGIDDLTRDAHVPFGEQDGQYRFFSEKLNDIEQERSKLPARAVEKTRIQNEAIKEAYSPLPSVTLNGTLSVSTGLKSQMLSGISAPLSGDRNPIQTIVSLVDPLEYDSSKLSAIDESRQKSAQYNIYLLGRLNPEMEDIIIDVYRCREIALKYRHDADQEVKEYCKGQAERAERKHNELVRLIKKSLLQGSFIFRGDVTAVDSIKSELLASAKELLNDVAKQVFDRYSEAAISAKTNVAERFLRAPDLNGITAEIDPLGLVKTEGGTPSIPSTHKAIISINDYLGTQGLVEGKRLSEHFKGAPFGWSQDTLRYLVAAMLVAGLIKLKVGGKEVKVKGPKAIEALKTNNTFKTVGVAPRNDGVDNKILARAAKRLTQLSAESVIPLEDDISKVAMKHFPQLQNAYGPLGEKLKSLGTGGVNRLSDLGNQLADVLLTDASDAASLLGSEDSNLFESLFWASEVKQKLGQGLEDTLLNIKAHKDGIERLPVSGVPGKLKETSVDILSPINDRLLSPDFFKYSTEYSQALTQIKKAVGDCVTELQDQQTLAIKECEQEFKHIPEWQELTNEEQNSLLAGLEKLTAAVGHDLDGFSSLMNQQFTIQTEIRNSKKSIQALGQERIQKKQIETQQGEQEKVNRTIQTAQSIKVLDDLDQLIQQLQSLRSELQFVKEFELSIGLTKEDSEGE